MKSVLTLTGGQLASRVRNQGISRVDVLREVFDHIRTVEPQVNALCLVREEEAMAEAEEADKAQSNGDAPSGLLEGVPVVVKAQFDVRGLATHHGSAALSGQLASRDSVVVERLRRNGAIVVGKANQPDFAMRWNTVSSATGWTRNPRDLSKSVGGSSGGDAACVASGMAAIGFGSDLAGSIRVPATFCAVYGLRATPGRIPFDAEFEPRDLLPAAEAMNSTGPLARSVDDLWLAFAATAGPSERHPHSLGSSPARTLQAPEPRKVARLVHEAGAVVDDEVVREVDAVCALLERSGYAVEDAAFPGAARTPDLWGELLCTDLRLRVLPHLHGVMEESCYDSIDKLSSLWPIAGTTEEYLDRWAERATILRQAVEWMADYPIIVSPVTGRAAPPALEFDGQLSAGEMAQLVGRMRNCLWPAALGMPAVALPTGVQVVGRPHHDEEVLAAAAAVEALGAPCLSTIES